MAVDVTSEIHIRRTREDVAAFAADPENAPDWYANIKQVQWETDPPLKMGSRIAFVANFMGRRLEYTYEVIEYEPGKRLVMSTQQGPFPMETQYSWEDTPGGGTRMILRNRGEPAGFSRIVAPLLSSNMARANAKDLSALKKILEKR